MLKKCLLLLLLFFGVPLVATDNNIKIFEFPGEWINTSTELVYPDPRLKELNGAATIQYYRQLIDFAGLKNEFFKNFGATLKQLPTTWPKAEPEKSSILKIVQPILASYELELQPEAPMAAELKKILIKAVKTQNEQENNDLINKWFVLEKAIYKLQKQRDSK